MSNRDYSEHRASEDNSKLDLLLYLRAMSSPTLLLSLGHHDSPKGLCPQDVRLGWAGVGDGGTPRSPGAGVCRWQDATEVWEVPFFSAGSV